MNKGISIYVGVCLFSLDLKKITFTCIVQVIYGVTKSLEKISREINRFSI